MKLSYLIPLTAILGFVLDCIVGDPEWMPHPIRFIGHLISAVEKPLRVEGDKPHFQRIKGGFFTALVLLVTAAATGLLVLLGHLLGRTAGGRFTWLIPLVIDAVLSAFCLAAKSLRVASMKVYYPLKRGRTETARHAVSMIVGRDTSVLDEKGIARAAVESVAESTSDGVIAPLFYLMIGGPVLGMVYKAVNTMDSMVGYKNDKYRYFGTASARLDDIVNFIPARLSALLLIAAAFLLRYDGRNAWKIWRRDRYKHASPNSAQTESVCAGALGVRLAGPAVYFGKEVEKPYIGDAKKEIEPEDIRRANRLMYAATILSVILFTLVRMAVCQIF